MTKLYISVLLLHDKHSGHLMVDIMYVAAIKSCNINAINLYHSEKSKTPIICVVPIDE